MMVSGEKKERQHQSADSGAGPLTGQNRMSLRLAVLKLLLYLRSWFLTGPLVSN
jgi:hypothetical protein